MKKLLRRLPLWGVLLVGAGLLVYGFWPVPIPVEVVQATRGDVQVTVTDDGTTRIREKYIVSAPVTGKLLRIELEEGDAVVQGETVLARIEPGDPTLLDAREVAEAEVRVRAADASVRQANAALERAEEAHALAQHEYQRALELIQTKVIAQSEFDNAEHQERIAAAEIRSAEFAVSVAEFERKLAEAAFIRLQPKANGERTSSTLTITSPIDGQVLRVFQESSGIVVPGTELLQIGDPHDLEMVIDVLSSDAVKIQPGARVFVEHWGGDGELEGTVRLVEPSGFAKTSALGVEEQRVNVIADFTSEFERRQSLGDGYRIEARIVVDQAIDVIKVAAGTLFRERNAWHVFRVVKGRARLQLVEIGKGNGHETEVIRGVSEDDMLILYPTDKTKDGVRVRPD